MEELIFEILGHHSQNRNLKSKKKDKNTEHFTSLTLTL